MKYVRMYADKNGDSHFEDVEVAMSLVDFAPPAPPLNLSPLMPSTNEFLCKSAWSSSLHTKQVRRF